MNLAAVLVAAIASFGIGAVWFAVLFGRPYRRLLGVAEGSARDGFAKTLVFGFLIDLVRAYVMIKVIAAMGAYSAGTGAEVGVWLWIGFVLTVGLGQLLYERRSWKLFAITYAYHLVALVAMGAILATW